MVKDSSKLGVVYSSEQERLFFISYNMITKIASDPAEDELQEEKTPEPSS